MPDQNMEMRLAVLNMSLAQFSSCYRVRASSILNLLPYGHRLPQGLEEYLISDERHGHWSRSGSGGVGKFGEEWDDIQRGIVPGRF